MSTPPPDDETRLAASAGTGQSTGAATTGASSGWLASSGAIDHGRFPPGTILGGRYRIVGRLGKGGMGEVFRADDLKLGQQVALKFLPPEVDRDPARLTQLHGEVRMARQVSHPNVCRVYDIDEVEGHTFLSMEYVDGEDLASLLRRIGRFPEERGLEIARQACAGLAAAHERGVIHRDFKPANVMLDGTGRVRITDFGLAGVSGEALRAGTPAYMAPEQIAGQEVTARSDIYALGLVLYEIFTGKRALDGSNLAELIRRREQAEIVPPSAITRGLSPEIDRAIMRCLLPDPAARPASALSVSAALPGGDPLAAALAAGETPSPDMVAAAGESTGLSRRLGVSLLGFVIVGLLVDCGLVGAQLHRRPGDVREIGGRARGACSRDPRCGRVSGAWRRQCAGCLDDERIRRRGWADRIARLRAGTCSPTLRRPSSDSGTAPARVNWYLPRPAGGRPSTIRPSRSPAWRRSSSISRAGSSSSSPCRRSSKPTKPAPRLSTGRRSSRPPNFNMAEFTSVTPRWTPRIYADQRTAWEGPMPGSPNGAGAG